MFRGTVQLIQHLLVKIVRDSKVALVAAWEMTAREVEERDKQARKWAEKDPKSVKRSEDNKKEKEPGKATLSLRGGAAKKIKLTKKELLAPELWARRRTQRRKKQA